MAGEHGSVELVGDETVEHFAKAVLLAALTAALAQVSLPVPGYPVPFSLQPFGSFFAGLLLGPLWGGAAMAVYLLAGIAGAPVFSNGASGLGYVLVGRGTGGFLVGFLVGAVVAGAIAHRQVQPRSVQEIPVPVQVGALVAGLVVIYAIGVPWLAAVTDLPLGRAAATMAPFVPPDVVKLLVAVAIVKGGYLVRE